MIVLAKIVDISHQKKKIVDILLEEPTVIITI